MLTHLFEASGFDVTTAITGFRAQAHLESERPIAQVKPWLAERVVFLADVEGDDATVVAPGRPMFRKGADSRALTTVLREMVNR